LYTFHCDSLVHEFDDLDELADFDEILVEILRDEGPGLLSRIAKAMMKLA
jgi:hypothetical protein